MRTFFLIFLTLLIGCFPAPGQGAELFANPEASYLVTGEATRLTVYIASPTAPDTKPVVPSVTDVAIRLSQTGRRDIRNNGKRELVHIYQYTIQSFKVGTHTIPSFEVSISGERYRSQPFELFVKSPDAITWQTTKVGTADLRFGSAVFTPDRQPFVGETFPAEVKVYLPATTLVAERGIAELEHNGLTAWRFEPSKIDGRANLPLGSYTALTFRSTVAAIQEGKISLGPGRARISVQPAGRRRGLIGWNSIPVALAVPAHEITARPLPAGAPASFNGAVGTFQIGVAAEVENLEEGDPIAVKLAVQGTGNLDSLRAPALKADPADWKTFDPSRLERQGERRNVTGRVLFSQIIRPLTPQKVIPPYELSFFDPKSERYQTITTAAIPFKIIPSKKSVLTSPGFSSAENSVRDMRDILGVVNPLRPQHSQWAILRYWHLVPASLALFLLVLMARKRFARRPTGPSHSKVIHQALATVEKADPDSREFLRAAGHFIEEWIPEDQRDEELHAILKRRDEECFRPSGNTEALPAKERSHLISTLRTKAMATASMLALCLTTLLSLGAANNEIYQQAETAWEEERYHTAAELYRSAHPADLAPADVEFNLANCHYRLGEPGLASLHYHRALLQDKHHREARINLSFLKAQQGVIEPYTPDDFLQKMVFLPTTAYREIMFAGLWLAILAILVLLTFRSITARVISWILLPLSALGAISSAVIYLGLTQTGSLVPLNPLENAAEISIVTAKEPLTARTEPRESAPKVISAPPGIPCTRLAERGAWTYLEFADLTRGWLPSSGLTPLVPTPTEP